MRPYFALSRTAHSLLDMAAPAFCALLWLGAFPPWHIIALSLGTAFAAYTAVYAMNDIVGLRDDRAKLSGATVNPGYSMDASTGRHPLAQGTLARRNAVSWTAAWFVLALAGSYILNPVIVLVLLAAAGIEVFYCRLLRVTHWRTLVSGLVKSSGPVAAVLVVDSHPALPRLLLMIAWLFFWEIGGQNIPSDWNDTEEDRRTSARTIPLGYGHDVAGLIIMAALSLSVLASGFLHTISPAALGSPFVLASLLLGAFLLLRPALRLCRVREGRLAARLFESASYYPLAMLALITVFLLGSDFPPGT